VSEEELVECFKVAGMIKTDPSDGSVKVKLYRDESGRLKGDALLTFMKAESVPLAVTLRDGFTFRDLQPISVQAAKFEIRGELKEKRVSKDEAALRKKQKKLEMRRLAEWDGGLLPSGVAASSVVILKGLFSEAEAAEADADFYANLKQDVQVECGKAGPVEKVTIFEGSEFGAAAVRFKGKEDAQRCVAMMNARSFGSGRLECELYDGVSDFRARALREAGKAAPGASSASAAEESVEEQEAKLESFAQWLEADSTDEDADSDAGGD